MDKVTTHLKGFNHDNVRILRKELEEALETVANRYGLRINLGKITFGGGSFHTKLTCEALGWGNNHMEQPERDFRAYATSYGLSVDDLGREFLSRGQVFTVCGLKPRNRKYPILAKNWRGQTYKFQASFVKQQLAKSA